MHDVSDMAVLVAVVDQGGFSAASRRLGMATSVISDRVKNLEARLGVKLLHRTTRSQVLTQAGARYLESARRIIADIAAMEARVTEESAVACGDLRITAPGPLGRQHVAPLVARFCQRHPQIRVHLMIEDKFTDILADGYDLAFRGGPSIDSALAGRCLFTTRRVTVASAGYLQQAGVPETPKR